MVLSGHLTRDALEAALKQVQLRDGKQALVVDCRSMQGYALDARHAFVDWNRRNASSISRVAVVTDNRMWWMVIATMSLASRRAMRAFATVQEASTWARDD